MPTTYGAVWIKRELVRSARDIVRPQINAAFLSYLSQAFGRDPETRERDWPTSACVVG